VTGGMTTARGSRASGSMTTAMGGTTTGGMTMAKGSKATSGTADGDGRHGDGKGQKEAARPPPPAYQLQHHGENVYKSRHLDFFKLIYSI